MKFCTLLKTTLFLSFAGALHAQDGPFPPDAWPASGDGDKLVHFGSVDFSLDGLGAGWEDTLGFLDGGDQEIEPISIGSRNGVTVTGNYLNISDFDYTEWDNFETIDILLQVYGNSAILAPDGSPRDFNFLIGTLPELSAPVGGSIPVEGKNSNWNWVLFSIPNDLRPSGGGRFVGFVPAGAQGDISGGGVNGGTIRIENVPGLTVHAVAFGEPGAFGTLDQINRFTPVDECEPEPNTNLAFIDIANETSQNMIVLNEDNQGSIIEAAVGPNDDKRRAVKAVGRYLNFAITDNYLGAPCSEPRTVKVCIEYFDDPELAGTFFGPDSYATDNQGGTGIYSFDHWEQLRGTGQWVKRAFVIPNVGLFGVGTAPLTGGPRFEFDRPISIARFDLAVLRTGDHPLAGLDPLADCVEDPRICSGEYGSLAELDLARSVFEGLAPGSSGGDQEMIEEEAGPVDDRRLAIRPAFDDGTAGFTHNFLNFAITDEVFGPTSQPNARLAMCLTYWDNPDLAGANFRPEAYRSVTNGAENFAFFPEGDAEVLEGTGTWREAYFEIPAIKFSGVNQGPQAAARILASDKIHISRVRYAVVRECGPTAGINPLAGCLTAAVGPPTGLKISRASNGGMRLEWPAADATLVLEESGTLNTWEDSTEVPTVEGEQNVLTIPMAPGSSSRFFRLKR
ncbi:hypothetical protein V2O64_25575 (plasmid) [Verrucomicrobiaceae bacterium 227]